MPNITVIKSHLFESIGRIFTDAEFDELCFEFGVEVDDVETELIEVKSFTTHISYDFFTVKLFSSLQMAQRKNMLSMS